MKLGLYWPEENMLTETLSGVIMVMDNDWPITCVTMVKSKNNLPWSGIGYELIIIFTHTLYYF